MTLTIHPLPGIPEVVEGDDLPALLLAAIARAGLSPEPGDVLVVTHKVVSKAEGAVVTLVGDEERAYRALVLSEAADVIRRRGDLVAIADAGAYVASQSSTYNGRPRPPQVLLDATGALTLGRRRLA